MDNLNKLTKDPAVDMSTVPKRYIDSLVTLLNFFEEMALSIEYRLADEPILRRYFAQTANELFHALEPFIHTLRIDRTNKSIFVNFERLIGRWSFIDDSQSYRGGRK